MRGNSHVRFGGAGWGNGPPERATPRPGPTLLDRLAELLAAAAGPHERCDERSFTFAMLACSAVLFNTLRQPP
jgi:hypothetical protein